MTSTTNDLTARLQSGLFDDADAKAAANLIERVIGDLPQDAIDGGWTARGISEYAKQLEAKIETLQRELERVKLNASRFEWAISDLKNADALMIFVFQHGALNRAELLVDIDAAMASTAEGAAQ
jgi:hypothetical protein